MMSRNRWIFPLILIAILVFTLSLRQLSDPDLGFHLKYGEWIFTHHAVPSHDLSTWSVSEHEYIDQHWLFQLTLYLIYKVGGYVLLSLFVAVVSMTLLLMLVLRNAMFRVPMALGSMTILVLFLVIEQRVATRPEMFSFLFLTIIWFICELYFRKVRNLLPLLPVIMLIWCNMHALFITGIAVMAVFGLSYSVKRRKTDLTFAAWLIASVLITLLNPYGLKGLIFPFELLTRFSPSNIYHHHIQEFMPFLGQQSFFLRDYLFLLMIGMTLGYWVIRRRTLTLHETLLPLLFGLLAMAAIRNIPLFAISAALLVSQPGHAMVQLPAKLVKRCEQAAWVLLLILPLALIPRVLTNAYYIGNDSFNKSGMGLNLNHQPELAANFLLQNGLKGKIINSMGFGGWLSWRLPQPVYIDGRLEVVREALYSEVVRTWKGELSAVTEKYRPDLIVYNYLKYYPWTLQLKNMDGWRMIYADGVCAIFAERGYRDDIKEIDIRELPDRRLSSSRENRYGFLEGFYHPVDYSTLDSMHMTILRMQLENPYRKPSVKRDAVLYFNRGNDLYRQGDGAEAIRYYDSAIALNPYYARAFNNRGMVRAAVLKDYRAALGDFTRAIEIDSDYADAWTGRGSVHFYLQDQEAAIRDWTRAAALGSRQAASLLQQHGGGK